MKVTILYILAVFKWSMYKARFHQYAFDGYNFKYCVYFTPRLYSPMYILNIMLGIVLTLVVSIFTDGLIEGFKQLVTHFKDMFDTENHKESTTTYENTFKQGTSLLLRKMILWRIIYID